MDDGQQMRITRRAYELWQQAGGRKAETKSFIVRPREELNQSANKSNDEEAEL